MVITSEIEKAQVSCSYQNISFFKTDGVSFHWNCKPQTSDPRSLDKGRQSRDINQITHYGIQGPYAQATGRVYREYTEDSEMKSSLFYYFSLLKTYFSPIAQNLPASALETMSPTPNAYEEQKTWEWTPSFTSCEGSQPVPNSSVCHFFPLLPNFRKWSLKAQLLDSLPNWPPWSDSVNGRYWYKARGYLGNKQKSITCLSIYFTQ